MKTTLLLFGVVVAAGCGAREHLTESHGRAYREFFAAQLLYPDARGRGTPMLGLDNQEAAAVAAGYQRSLAGKGQATQEEPILFIAPPKKATQSQDLPPSVPKDER